MYGFGCAPTNVNKRKGFTAGQQLYVKGTKAKTKKLMGGGGSLKGKKTWPSTTG
jgi:hypothetical protein